MSLFPSDDELERVLVGPDSVAWRFGSDARLYLVMPRGLRIMGPAQLRLRRRAIARGPLGPGRTSEEIAHAA